MQKSRLIEVSNSEGLKPVMRGVASSKRGRVIMIFDKNGKNSSFVKTSIFPGIDRAFVLQMGHYIVDVDRHKTLVMQIKEITPAQGRKSKIKTSVIYRRLHDSDEVIINVDVCEQDLVEGIADTGYKRFQGLKPNFRKKTNYKKYS